MTNCCRFLVHSIFLLYECIYTITFFINKLWNIITCAGNGYINNRKKPPICLDDPALGKHGYAHLQSIRMHYVTNGSEDKPLFLMLHGFPDFWFSWRHQLKEYKNTHRVVAVDLRGYGDTDKPSGIYNYSVGYLLEDIRQIIDAFGYSNCVLMGHDWGGILCWHFALKYPEMVTQLIIINACSFPAFYNCLKTNPKQLKKSWYIFFFLLPLLPECILQRSDFKVLSQVYRGRKNGVKAITVDELEAYKYNFSRNAFTAPINYYRSAFFLNNMSKMGTASRSKRGAVSMPTLIIWGEPDAYLEKELAKLSSECCSGQVIIKYVENGGHFVHMVEPAIVNTHIRNFLKAC